METETETEGGDGDHGPECMAAVRSTEVTRKTDGRTDRQTDRTDKRSHHTRSFRGLGCNARPGPCVAGKLSVAGRSMACSSGSGSRLILLRSTCVTVYSAAVGSTYWRRKDYHRLWRFIYKAHQPLLVFQNVDFYHFQQ